MRTDPLFLALTFDAEADVFDGSIGACSPATLGWRGIEEGIPLIVAMLRAQAECHGADLRATWFVRTDREIGDAFGDAAYLLRHYAAIWKQRSAAGDEIGFHPHFTKHAGADGSGATHCSEIDEALSAVRLAGFTPTTSRMGEAFGSNAAMESLEKAGFTSDCTAMPGRVRRDADRCLDWSGTPHFPYHPGVVDYRRPTHPARRLLEIPMSMAMVKADYDSVPLSRYVDLSFRHTSLCDGLRPLLASARGLVTVTHPSTILSGITANRHGLLSFEAEEFRRNLAFVFDECARACREVRCVTLDEYARLFSPSRSEPALQP